MGIGSLAAGPANSNNGCRDAAEKSFSELRRCSTRDGGGGSAVKMIAVAWRRMSESGCRVPRALEVLVAASSDISQEL
jgi:hypothetical protein